MRWTAREQSYNCDGVRQERSDGDKHGGKVWINCGPEVGGGLILTVGVLIGPFMSSVYSGIQGEGYLKI